MSACTFFGHRECYGLDREKLYHAIEALIGQGVDTFYVGNQGQFDAMVRGCLKELSAIFPHISYSVVLAYLPGEKQEFEDYADAIYPEGMENGPARFAIDCRNRWLMLQADWVICYVRNTWGGAYKYCKMCHKKGKRIINLSDMEISFS